MTDHRHEIDMKSVIERLGGMWDLAEELANMTITDSPEIVVSLRESIAREDGEAAHRHAHSLKGLVAGLGCTRCAATAGRIEALAAQRDFQTARKLLPELENQLDLSLTGLRQHFSDRNSLPQA